MSPRHGWEEYKPIPVPRPKTMKPPKPAVDPEEQASALRIRNLHTQIVDANRDLRKYARMYVVAKEKGNEGTAAKYKDIIDKSKADILNLKALLAEFGEEFDDHNLRR